MWFAKSVRKTSVGIVVTGENVDGTRTVNVLLTEEIIRKLKEVLEDEGSHDV